MAGAPLRPAGAGFGQEAGTMTAILSIIVPTFNEADNVAPMVDRLHAALDGLDWEVIFVDDDSPDGTWDRVAVLAKHDPRVRGLRRIGRRGLSSACIEGMLSSAAPYLAVMDGDLQHDETLLRRMLDTLQSGRADIAVASRYVQGGHAGGLAGDGRRLLSQAGNWLGRLVLRAEMSDPMSGYFMLRRDLFERTVHRLSGRGFKILADLVASAKTPPKMAELPLEFRPRLTGDSKLDTLVAWEYLLLLADKTVGRAVPLRFAAFVMVGMVGALLHLAILGLLMRMGGMAFLPSQTVAAAVAMTVNFFLNNVFTHRDARLRGGRLWLGLLSFMAVCSAGAAVNLSIAQNLFGSGVPWWLAGLLGAAVGAVWNYAVTTTLTWWRR
jgi:dolichol-phosphate mannosyltransferase